MAQHVTMATAESSQGNETGAIFTGIRVWFHSDISFIYSSLIILSGPICNVDESDSCGFLKYEWDADGHAAAEVPFDYE